MASTFDISFARSAGMAALFEAPANSFRWKGAGKLSVDAQGISIAVKRGLLSLFSRTDPPHRRRELTEVYREGEHFESSSAPRAPSCPYGPAATRRARIVKLLPTRRTVEIERIARSRRNLRPDGRALAWLVFKWPWLSCGALSLPQRIVANGANTGISCHSGGPWRPAPAVVSPSLRAGTRGPIENPAAGAGQALRAGNPANGEVATRKRSIFELELSGAVAVRTSI